MKLYRTRIPTLWWTGRWAYSKFILREISSVFVALFVAMTICQIRALATGPEAYAEFQNWMQSPLVVALNLIIFGFVVFHAVTWFNLAPRAMVVRVGGKRLPDALIAGSNFAAWLVASAVVGWFLVGG